ncbi:MAG: hypothetical protein AAB410_04495 [Patescibacteria group bacterium]
MSLLKEKLELKAEEAEFKIIRMFSRFDRWQKRIILLCMLAAIPAYFISKTVANRYYSSRYQQYLIQGSPSFSEAQELILDRADIASLGQNEYSAAVQIVNRNLDLAAKNVPYEIKFLAVDGSEAAPAERGRFYILPNSKKYLIAPKILSQAPIISVNLIFLNKIFWQKKYELPEVNLITSQPKGSDQLSPPGYALAGGVQNNSPYFIKEVKLTFLLYGAGGKIIGASQRSEFDMQPYERRDYKQIWSGISGRNVVRAEASAETNLLDKTNLAIPETNNAGGAGDLGR